MDEVDEVEIFYNIINVFITFDQFKTSLLKHHPPNKNDKNHTLLCIVYKNTIQKLFFFSDKCRSLDLSIHKILF